MWEYCYCLGLGLHHSLVLLILCNPAHGLNSYWILSLSNTQRIPVGDPAPNCISQGNETLLRLFMYIRTCYIHLYVSVIGSILRTTLTNALTMSAIYLSLKTPHKRPHHKPEATIHRRLMTHLTHLVSNGANTFIASACLLNPVFFFFLLFTHSVGCYNFQFHFKTCFYKNNSNRLL